MIHTAERYQDSVRDRGVARDNREREKDLIPQPQPVVVVPARIYDTQHEAETIGEMWPSYDGQDALKFLESQKRSQKWQ